MKKIIELSVEEFRNVVNGSKSLCEKLQSRIEESEMEWVSEKLHCLRHSLSNWCIGTCCRNFLQVVDPYEFVNGVKESVRIFGGSERLKAKISQCEKLNNSNLFGYVVEQLSDIYLEDELNPITDYMFMALCETSGQKVGKNCEDYLGIFQNDLRDWLYDEEKRTLYEPSAVMTA